MDGIKRSRGSRTIKHDSLEHHELYRCRCACKKLAAYLWPAHNAHISAAILAAGLVARDGKKLNARDTVTWRLTCLRRVKLSMARLLLPLAIRCIRLLQLGWRRNLLAYARRWLHTPRGRHSPLAPPLAEFSFWIHSKRLLELWSIRVTDKIANRCGSPEGTSSLREEEIAEKSCRIDIH